MQLAPVPLIQRWFRTFQFWNTFYMAPVMDPGYDLIFLSWFRLVPLEALTNSTVLMFNSKKCKYIKMIRKTKHRWIKSMSFPLGSISQPPLKRTVLRLLQNRLKLISLESKSWCVGHVDFRSTWSCTCDLCLWWCFWSGQMTFMNLHLMSVIRTCYFCLADIETAFPIIVDSVAESWRL